MPSLHRPHTGYPSPDLMDEAAQVKASTIRTGHYGLGPIGVEVARLTASRRSLVPVAAVDVRPDLVGRSLAEVIGVSTVHEVRVTEAMIPAGAEAQVVCHCTGSALEQVSGQIVECVELGWSVVSTCEELSYPWVRSPGIAAEIDALARARGVVVLGTGINPGFAMDYLPIVLSGGARRVDHVRVHRVQDARMRRIPLQAKIGANLDPEEFDKLVKSGAVRHVGLPESAQAIAGALGWELSELRDEIEPVIALEATPSGLGLIEPGRVTGVRQTVTGFLEDEHEVVSLRLEMAIGLRECHDTVELRGDPDVLMVIPGGLHGDVGTAAVVVNAIEQVVHARPGLRVMTELAPPRAGVFDRVRGAQPADNQTKAAGAV
jgi:hypothetical protein